MADYTIVLVLVEDILPGGGLRVLRNGTVTIKSAADDSVLGTATTNANGRAVVTSPTPTIYYVTANGFVSDHITAGSILESAAAAALNNDAGVASFIADTSPSSTRAALNTAMGDEAADNASGLRTGLSPVFAGKVDKGSLVINVRDYGAVGDGTTDDTTAFTNAIAAASNSRPLFIPGGHYKITSTLTLPSGLVMYGSGRNPTNGLPTRLNFSTLTTTPALSMPDTTSEVYLADFYLTGRTTGSGNEIQATGTVRGVTLERITINTATTGAGVSFSVGSGSVIRSSIRAVQVVGGLYGFDIGAGCTSINLLNCYSLMSTGFGYRLAGTYLSLNGCAADTSTLYGYAIVGGVGVALTGCGAETNGRSGFYCSGAKQVVFNACRGVSNNSSANAVIPGFALVNDGSDNVTFVGCTDTTPNAASPWSVSNNAGTVPTVVTIIACDFTAKGVHNIAPFSKLSVRTVATEAGTAARAPLNIPHGVAPTTPVNGDMWTTTAGLFVRVNGVTKTVTLT